MYFQNSTQQDTQGAKDDRQDNSKIPTPNKVHTFLSLILHYDLIHFKHYNTRQCNSVLANGKKTTKIFKDQELNRPPSKRFSKPIQTKNNDYEYYNVLKIK
jgi:hypothetical protein